MQASENFTSFYFDLNKLFYFKRFKKNYFIHIYSFIFKMNMLCEKFLACLAGLTWQSLVDCRRSYFFRSYSSRTAAVPAAHIVSPSLLFCLFKRNYEKLKSKLAGLLSWIVTSGNGCQNNQQNSYRFLLARYQMLLCAY